MLHGIRRAAEQIELDRWVDKPGHAS
jgi:hypothetical protein